MKKFLIGLLGLFVAAGIWLGVSLPHAQQNSFNTDQINAIVSDQIKPISDAVQQLQVVASPDQKGQIVGATIPVAVARFESSLASKITSSANSMTLVSGTDTAGHSLSGYLCFTLDEGTATVEDVCGTASSTAITSMIRGIDPVTGTSSVTSLQHEHRRGADVKITDSPQLLVVSRILNGNETLPNAIKYDSSVASSTLGSNTQNLASVAYVIAQTVNAGTLWVSGGSSSIRNTNAGFVGINTLSPTDQLSVTGNAALYGSDATSTLQGALKFSSPGHPTAYAGIAGKTNSGGTDQTDLLFYTGFGTASEKMRLMSNTGYLGIGTSTPAGNLVVQGTSGQTGNLFTLASSTGSTLFSVGPTGAALTIAGVAYTFPANQGAASTTLINNGSGVLTWGVKTPALDGSNSVSVASSGTSWTVDDPTGTTTLTTLKSQKVMLTFAGQFSWVGNGQVETHTLQFNVDSGTILTCVSLSLGTAAYGSNGTSVNMSCSMPSGTLAAGTHTFKVRYNGSSASSVADTLSGTLYVVAID